MVKNLPTVERSTRIRFGKNCRQEQADNTIVFNASDEFLEANTSNAIYMTPMRLNEDLSDRNVTVLAYNRVTKEITDSGAVAEDVFDITLQNATTNGNVTANVVSFNNPETSVTTLSNVGVANGSPVHTLDVGSNLYVDDTGSNVLVVSGNTHITQDLVVDGNVLVEGVVTSFHSENFKVRDGIIELGKDNTLFDTTLDLGLVLTRPESNVTIGFVEATDEIILAYTQSSANGKSLVPLTSEDVNVHVYGRLYTEANVGIVNTSPIHTLDVGSNLYVDDVGSNILVVTGNVEATAYYGDGTTLTGVALLSNFDSNVSRIQVLEIDLASNASRVGTLETDLTSNASRVGTLETDLASNASRVGTLEVDLTSNASRVGTLEVDLASNASRVGTLEVDLASNAARVGTLETGLAGAEANIVTINNDLITTTTRVSVVETDLASNASRVGVLETNLTSNAARVGTLETNLASNAARVGVLETDLTSNATRVGVLETDLASNAARVGTLEVDLTSNASRVGILEVDLASNAARVGTLETIKAPKDGPIFTGFVGIANASSIYDLSVGSNLFVDTDGSNVLIVHGNVSATSYYGDGSKLTGLVTALQDVSDNGNTTTNTIEFNNTATGLVAVSNIVAGGNVTATTFLGDGSQLTGLVTALQDVSDNGNTTTNTIEFNNTATGLVTVSNIVAGGNVTATTFLGDGGLLSNLVTTLQDVSDNGNTTSNVVQFTNTTTGLVTTSNIVVGGNVTATTFLGDGGLLSNLVTTLQDVSDNGNTTSNTLQFTNAHTAFTTDLTSNVGVNLNQLANVTLTTPQNEDILVYDGSNWTNQLQNHTFLQGKALETISKGDVVYAAGHTGNEIFNIRKARADSSTTMPALGVAYQSLAVNGVGLVVTFGRSDGLNTDGFISGETVYVSNVVAGGISNVVPQAETDLIQNVGLIVKPHISTGIIDVTGVGRVNAIPNAQVVTTQPPHIYTNGGGNTFEKMDPADVLTKLQTLQQVTDTGNTTSNTIQFTNATTGLVTTANLEVGSNISVVGLADATNKYLPMVDTDGTFIKSPVYVSSGGTYVISAAEAEFLGNITLSGNNTVVSSTSVTIEDRIFGIGANNEVHNLDTGIMMEHKDDGVYANIAVIYHADEHRFSIGYTQNTFTDDHILHYYDDDHLMLIDLIGNVNVQNNITVVNGSYYGDGTTLTGLALLSNFTSNVSRIGVLETDLTSNASRVGVLETDLASNAARVGTLEVDLTSNATRVGVLETDLTSNASRVGTLETDLTSNASRVGVLEVDLASNAARVGVLETDLTSNAARVGVLETDLASNAARVGVLETDLASNAARVGVLETDVSSLETDLTSNATRIGVLETDLASNATRVGVLETDLTSNAARVGTLETDKADLLDPTFTSNITVSNVVYVTSGLVTNTGEVTKKTYSYSGSISSGDKPYINVNYTSNVFYSKISAQLVEGDEEVSTLVLEVGGGHKTGATPSSNIAIGTKNIFGGTSTNPWNPTIITTGNRVSMQPSTILDGQGDYHIFIEYTSPKTDGGVTTIDEDSITVATFTY